MKYLVDTKLRGGGEFCARYNTSTLNSLKFDNLARDDSFPVCWPIVTTGASFIDI